jgi:hypothetical protein
MDTSQIIIGIVIVLVIYLLYLWFFGDGTRSYLSGMHSATKELMISPANLPRGGSSDYTYSIWLYINNWNYRVGEKKDVFARGDSNNPSPIVSLGANLNNVEVSLGTWPGAGGQGGQGGQVSTCTLENVPLQAWANVIMTLNNRSLDLYLDGKLVRTCVLPGVPIQSSGEPLVVCGKSKTASAGGFDGHISNFQYFARAINPREAYAIYREGPGGSNWFTNLINKYRIKVAFMNNNIEVNSFEI